MPTHTGFQDLNKALRSEARHPTQPREIAGWRYVQTPGMATPEYRPVWAGKPGSRPKPFDLPVGATLDAPISANALRAWAAHGIPIGAPPGIQLPPSPSAARGVPPPSPLIPGIPQPIPTPGGPVPTPGAPPPSQLPVGGLPSGGTPTENAARLLAGAVTGNPFITQEGLAQLMGGRGPLLNQIQPGFFRYTSPTTVSSLLGLLQAMGLRMPDIQHQFALWRPPGL